MARSTAWLLHLTVAAGLVAVSAHAQRLEPLDQAPAAVGTLAVHAADQPGVPLQNDRGGKRRRVRRGPRHAERARGHHRFRERPVSIAPVAVPVGGAVMSNVRSEP